jgi:hypothetical protein
VTQNKQVRATFGYTVDTASIQQAIQANQALQASFGGVNAQLVVERDAIENLSLAFADIDQRNALNKLAQDAAAGTISVTELATKLTDLGASEAEIRKVAEDMERIQRAGQDTGGGASGFGTLTSKRRGIGALGSLVGAEAGGGAISDVARIISVGAAFGVAGAAIGVLAIGLKAVSDEAAKTSKALEDEANAARQAREATLTATTKELEDRKAYLVQLVTLQQQEVDQANAAVAARRQAVGSYADIPGLGAILEPELQGLRSSATTAAENLTKTQDELAGLDIATAGLTSTTADATAAEKLLTAARVKNAGIVLDIDKLDADARKQRAEEDTRAIEVLQRQINLEKEGSDAQTQLIDLQATYYNDLLLVSTATSTAADNANAVAAAFERINSANTGYLGALKDQIDAQDAITKTEAKIAQLRADAADKAADAEQKRSDADAQSRADADDKRAQIEADGADKLAQIESDGAEKRQQIEADDADKRAKILRQYNEDYNTAVANRDTLAALKAKQKRDDDLADADKARQKATDDLAKSLKKQEDALAKSQAKQLQQVEDSLRKQVEAHQRAYEQQLATIQDGLAKALVVQNQALAQYRVDLTNFTNAVIAMGDYMNSIASGYGFTTRARDAGAIAQPPGDFGSPSNPLPPVSGTGAQRSPNVANYSGGGMTLNYAPTIHATNTRTLARQLDLRFAAYLQAGGYF